MNSYEGSPAHGSSGRSSIQARTDILCRNGCGFFGNQEWQWYCSKCWREFQVKASVVRSVSPSTQSTSGGGSGDHHEHNKRPSTAPQGASGRSTRTPSNAPATSGGFHPFGLHGPTSMSPTPPSGGGSKNHQQTSPTKGRGSPTKRSKSNAAETLKAKKQTFDQNVKHNFQKVTNRFTGGKKDVSPEKSKTLSKSLSAKPAKSSTSTAKSAASQQPPELKAVSQEFADFLNRRVDKSGIADISRQIKMVVDKINSVMKSSEAETSVEELSTSIQEFYLNFQKRLETKQQFHALTDDEVTTTVDYAERYITTACYKQLFSPVVSTDEEKDLELQTKIRSLNWISTKELNCTIDEANQDVRTLLFEAINDILEIDGQLAPQDKMACLVKCSKKVFEMLQLSLGPDTPASADDFLPCLIYICLKANPPRVQSNINFISRFCNENKLRMGEAGYFFANLCCAISFVENMTADSINMDAEEFESYVSGKSVPPGSWRTSLLMCEGLQQMSHNLKSLSDFKARHDQVLQEALRLQDEMAAFQVDIEAEVEAVLERTQYTLVRNKPKGQPVNLDADLDFEEAPKSSLPPPLVPTDVRQSPAPSPTPPIPIQRHASPPAISTQSPHGAVAEDKADTSDLLGESNNVTCLEDYLSLSSLSARGPDDISILSFNNDSLSASSALAPNFPPSPVALLQSAEAAYRGFTAQANQIMSISCDNSGDMSNPPPSLPHPKLVETCPETEEESVDSTASSSPLVSAATSVSTSPPMTPVSPPAADNLVLSDQGQEKPTNSNE